MLYLWNNDLINFNTDLFFLFNIKAVSLLGISVDIIQKIDCF